MESRTPPGRGASIRLALIALACLAATLINTTARASNCAGTSTGLIPLTDLGTGTYHGLEGGLYPGGSNHRPFHHDSAGIAIANSLVPLDTLGNPSATGRIVLISIGMSNCTLEFSRFVSVANADPVKNPRVYVIDCALGGQSADRITSLSAAYWDTVVTRLRGHGSSPLQAQAVWIKEADADPTGGFPAATDTLLENLGTLVRNIRTLLPNVKLTYLTSRIYAGYASSTLNPEPYAYESGFAVQQLVGAQIAGVDSLNFDINQGAVHAPWLSWGPYLWADGLVGRKTDGLIWRCSEFQSDGTHPADSARTFIADSLDVFFRTDASTRPWFVAATASLPGTSLSAGLDFAVSPNPARGPIDVAFTPAMGERWTLEVVDLAGRRVASIAAGTGSGTRAKVRWTPVARLRAGVYWLLLETGGGTRARRAVVVTR
ncbi:MAG TPA: T9SS type A sorting domain-containing protein [Candidatus Udaeobacter sp.]|jgi:hypothetical protein|nr:T9SS type A sorting domain-containing protein [Candidatus Udaeobacter sp.]